MKKNYWLGLLSLLLLILTAGSSWAAMGSISSFKFNEATADTIGSGYSQNPDGKKDASFAVDIKGSGVIVRFDLKNLTSGQSWDTTPNSSSSILLVQNRSAETMNTQKGMRALAFVLGTSATLSINDRDAILSKGGDFRLTVHFVDKSTASATVTVKPVAIPTPTTPPSAGQAISILAVDLKGQGNRDLVANTNKFAANGVNDWELVTRIKGSGTITGLKLINTAGDSAAWDSLTTSGTPFIAVTLPTTEVLNRADGTVNIPINGEMTLHLWVENTGSLNKENTRTKLVILMQDGSTAERTVTLPSQKTTTAVNAQILSLDYNGVGYFDFVNSSKKPGSNINPDYRFDVKMEGTATIVGVRIKDLNDSARVWDTLPETNNGLVGVTEKDSGLLNKSDGSLSHSVQGETLLSLWVEEKGDMKKQTQYRITLVLNNGKVLEKDTPKAAKTEKTRPADKSTDKKAAERSVRMTAKPVKLTTSVVAKKETTGSGGQNNVSLMIRVRGTGTITYLSLANQTGSGTWDTIPKNNRPILGVRQKAKLLNRADSSVNIPIKNTADFELIAEDNGTLLKTGARYLLTLFWDDGEETQQVLSW